MKHTTTKVKIAGKKILVENPSTHGPPDETGGAGGGGGPLCCGAWATGAGGLGINEPISPSNAGSLRRGSGARCCDRGRWRWSRSSCGGWWHVGRAGIRYRGLAGPENAPWCAERNQLICSQD